MAPKTHRSTTPHTIQGLKIPATLENALREGFRVEGTDQQGIIVRGNRQWLVGRAQISKDGLTWLECPIYSLDTYRWDLLAPTRKTSVLVA